MKPSDKMENSKKDTDQRKSVPKSTKPTVKGQTSKDNGSGSGCCRKKKSKDPEKAKKTRCSCCNKEKCCNMKCIICWIIFVGYL